MEQGARGRLRGLGLLAVAVLAAATGIVTYSLQLTEWLQRPAVDARFSIRGSNSSPKSVVIVGIDDETVATMPRYPFSRTYQARVLERLKAAGARLIVEDVAFDRPSDPAADEALFEAARRAAPVVFGTSLIEPGGQTEVLGGNSNLASIGALPAAARLPADPDGVLRHTSSGSEGLTSIAGVVARKLGRPVAPSLLRSGWIDYPGRPGTFAHLPFVRVLRGQFQPASVRGKVIVIGATAPVLQDTHSTPVGAPMAGPEVQAAAIATALSGMPLRAPSSAITILLILLAAVALPLLALRTGTVAVAVAAAAILAAWCLTSVLAFNSGIVLDFSDPVVTLILSATGAVMLGMWLDSRERRRLRERFAAGERATIQQVLGGVARQPLMPDAVIAGYRLEQVLERGGMGVVYRAVQLALDRPVALKLIANEHAHNPEFRERFQRESRMAAAVEHANVIPVYEAGDDDGLLFIAMRLVNGYDLAQLLQRCGPLPPRDVARLAREIGAALDAAHAHGLVHRDVKPANILLSADEPPHAYLTDFGLARQLQAVKRVTSPGGLVGTVDYMSPEQIEGEPAGPAADVYSLSAVLFHCLAGKIPYPRETAAAAMWAHLSATPPPLSRIRPGLPVELDALIARGMSRDPSERFESPGALAAALDPLLQIDLCDGMPEGGAKDAAWSLNPAAPTLVGERP